MKNLIILSLSFAVGIANTSAQMSEKEQVESVIFNLFDGMRQRDSLKLAAALHPDCLMRSIGEGEQARLFEGSRAAFIAAASAPSQQVWDERISDLQIFIDGNMACAWMQYAFYLDDRRLHTGVNQMTFFKSEKGWQAIFICDTRKIAR